MRIIIIGSEYSGISLLCGIINCTDSYDIIFPNTLEQNILENRDAQLRNGNYIYPLWITKECYTQTGISILNSLHRMQLSLDDTFYIWMIRNPVICASKYVLKDQMSIDEALLYWEDINVILWYFLQSVPQNLQKLIKYEDLVMNTKSLKELFVHLEIDFNTQYLKYGDFCQKELSGTSFNTGEIDIEQIDPYDKSQIFALPELWEIHKNKDIISKMNYSSADQI